MTLFNPYLDDLCRVKPSRWSDGTFDSNSRRRFIGMFAFYERKED